MNDLNGYKIAQAGGLVLAVLMFILMRVGTYSESLFVMYRPGAGRDRYLLRSAQTRRNVARQMTPVIPSPVGYFASALVRE
jgi:hypothetical protein